MSDCSSDTNFHFSQESGDASYGSDDNYSPPSSPCLFASVQNTSQSPVSISTDIEAVVSTPNSSQQSSLPNISGTFSSLEIDTPSSQPLTTRKRGRPFLRKGGFRKGHAYYPRGKRVIPNSTDNSAPVHKKVSKPISSKLSKLCGYSSYSKVPSQNRTSPVTFKTPTSTFQREVHIPTGNRIIDVGILCEVFSSMRCTNCSRHLILYEEKWLHGWQTYFRVKCSSCHHQVASFPSSRTLDGNPKSPCVNQPFKSREMNEITMRSILSVHSTGMSWRDMLKMSTIIDLPPPLVQMPSKYLDKLESASKSAVSSSIDFFCNELCNFVDSKPSPEPNATNVAVSFDSSWHTRGFYSNIGFGAAISTQTKKVLDYEILSRNCEKCSKWSDEKKKAKPVEYAEWMKHHEENCNRNFVGSSQKMEPEAARRIWSRSLAKNLCYSVFVGDGDAKSYQEIKNMNPYSLVEVEKQECLTHVSKRLKKHLKNIKQNTKSENYVQHKLNEWKADYIAGNYSTVILQHKGSTPEAVSKGLYVLLDHSSGDHSGCPKGVNSWCRWNNPSKPPPAVLTTFTAIDILKVKEVFELFASPEFCSHLTLGLTQNANESLHHRIWTLSPKAKYVSIQSIRISTALAILMFNESELALYTLLQDLNLHPTSSSFFSIVKRLEKTENDRQTKENSNYLRTRRRKKLISQARESALLKAEGGSSYSEGKFGSERKRKLNPPTVEVVPPGAGDVLPKRQKLVRGRSNSSSSDSSAGSDSDGEESDTLCGICDDRLPDPVALRCVMVGGREKTITDWVECTKCSSWVHCYCADIDIDVATQVDNYVCMKH